MICFQISIFAPLETTNPYLPPSSVELWFAFKLVSLPHWKQHKRSYTRRSKVVICFQISIFAPLETTSSLWTQCCCALWFAFKLVSLPHWKQLLEIFSFGVRVVICFQISIFAPLETTGLCYLTTLQLLWFAFKLVSLPHWKQRSGQNKWRRHSCDLLSN